MVDTQLRRRGIADERVLAAMLEIPREEFVPLESRLVAYQDAPTHIGEGQTISQPYMTALMAESLELRGTESVLEVGAGCGYAAAVLGALAARDWRPMHHDKDFAVNRNGTRDIFLNTPNQAAWFERFVTDWTGPYGRLQRMTFRMLGSIFPGDTMVFRGEVTDAGVDETGCGWVVVDISVSVDDDPKTTCKARVALPVTDDDNPWERTGDRWLP